MGRHRCSGVLRPHRKPPGDRGRRTGYRFERSKRLMPLLSEFVEWLLYHLLYSRGYSLRARYAQAAHAETVDAQRAAAGKAIEILDLSAGLASGDTDPSKAAIVSALREGVVE